MRHLNLNFNLNFNLTPKTAGLLGAVAFALLPAVAHAGGTNLVQDGSFEAATVGSHLTGASLGDGWTSASGNVFVSSSAPEAYDGLNTVNFGGLTSQQGTLSQSIATTLGQRYTISFYAASDNPNAALTASFGTDSLSINPVPNSGVFSGPSDFTHFTFDSTADSALTTLTFAGTKTEKIGIVLDDVSVAAVPEASTTLSFGLLLALGTGGLWVGRKKRQSQGVAA